jgi:hypothetical protein
MGGRCGGVGSCRSFDCVRLITPPSKDRSLGTPMITPPSKDRSLGTPMTPDFAQEDEQRTNKSKGRSRFLRCAAE